MTEKFSSADLKAQVERAEHFQKILKNFVALSGQVAEFMIVDPEKIPGDVQQCLNRLTEAGMWFRMAFDVERLNQPRIAGMVLRDKPSGVSLKENLSDGNGSGGEPQH